MRSNPRGKAEAAEGSLTLCDLLDSPSAGRNSEQLSVAAGRPGKVNEFAGRAPDGRVGDQIPIRCKVRHLAAFGGHPVDIDRRAMVLPGLNHLIQPLPATEGQIMAVRRPNGRVVLVTVVGQSPDLAFEIHDPKIGALVGVFVTLMRIGDQRQRPAVRAPDRRPHVDSEMGHLLRRSAIARHNVQLRWRRCGGIARIRHIASLVETDVHPIINAAFEALCELLLERRQFGRLRCGSCFPGERDPAVIGAEDRSFADTGDLKCLAARPVHSQKPDLAFGSWRLAVRTEGQELSVGAPSRSGGAEGRTGQSNRKSGSIRRADPEFGVALILGLYDAVPDEDHPAPIR